MKKDSNVRVYSDSKPPINHSLFGPTRHHVDPTAFHEVSFTEHLNQPCSNSSSSNIYSSKRKRPRSPASSTSTRDSRSEASRDSSSNRSSFGIAGILNPVSSSVSTTTNAFQTSSDNSPSLHTLCGPLSHRSQPRQDFVAPTRRFGHPAQPLYYEQSPVTNRPPPQHHQYYENSAASSIRSYCNSQTMGYREDPLIGRYVRNHFPGYGTFVGQIVDRRLKSATVPGSHLYETLTYYRVQYSDGDAEDLLADEIYRILT